MQVLGIKPSLGKLSPLKGGGRHDAGACLIVDGEIVAAAEEARFSRNKRALDEFPEHSIGYVLDHAGMSLSDVDVIGVGRDRSNRAKMVRYDPGSYVPSSLEDLFFLFREGATILADRADRHIEAVDQRIEDCTKGEFEGEYVSVGHHRCHAMSAACCDAESRPAVVTIDARGEHDSTVLWDTDLNRVRTFPWYNSIGLFYAIGCQYLGFRRGWDAGKVMGLAPYGDTRESFEMAFESLVEYGGGEYDVTDITRADDPVVLLEEHFGPRRVYPKDFEDHHRDFAYHLQETTERIVCDLIDRSRRKAV